MSYKILSVAGARPNFMKIAPVHQALEAEGTFDSRIVHTGQHYDDEMSGVFLRQLGLPDPHAHLGVGSGSHAQQTARVMTSFEQVMIEEEPDAVLVVGDVNSTLAAALVAAKLHVPVGHVEAGLRSFDERMPEEINRKLTDQLADWLFVTEQSGLENLEREGVADERVFFVGNVMIDSLVRCREKARKRPVLDELGIEDSPYVVMTMHRPSNVDEREALETVVRVIENLASEAKVVFPMHPRTRANLRSHDLLDRVLSSPGVEILEPLGYLDFLRLLESANLVVTDSGGIQEETTFLQVPCLTVRENTERPVTVEVGTNELVPLEPKRIVSRARRLMQEENRSYETPPLWDGKAATRIAEVLREELDQSS